MNENKHHIALVGFANSGKSTLFNALSGENQKVGNWSGVTVSIRSKTTNIAKSEVKLSDLPGLSSLNQKEEQGEDLTISHEFLKSNYVDCLINVIDATQLQRQLVLTSQLLELGIPMIVLLNKVDRKEAINIDTGLLSKELGCPVFNVSANDKAMVNELSVELLKPSHIENHKSIDNEKESNCSCTPLSQLQKRHEFAEQIVRRSIKRNHLDDSGQSLTDKIDDIVLHPWIGIPVFLGMMYLLFMFAINVGSAFIDFFDILSGTLFVEYPLHFLSSLNLPEWLTTIVEGVGAGLQTVATFIPVIMCLFIGLSLLESSGYLARAAFVVDKLMQSIGLPGKAFVPLIVGFGCTVPAVMAARVLDSERERITTVMMSPFMSCGARLPVYALFAAAFFPENGQNLVFLLYLIGIAAAIFTGFLLKKTVLSGKSSHTFMELPLYELPKLTDISKRVYSRTKGFVTGAGKTIVIVVCILNFVNSISLNGEFGNQDSEQSILSEGAKVVMPVLAPMGVKEENWQAGVGIITGIFAKEVLVATFNSLYSPTEEDEQSAPSLSDSWEEGVASIKENLLGIQPEDPLGVDVGDLTDLAVAAEEQEVELTTYSIMQNAFAGSLGAFSYLLFILLYTPCAAAMGAIKNEVGGRWAGFAAIWSFAFAYMVATLCYQIGTITVNPIYSLICIGAVLMVFVVIYMWLKSQGNKILTIPVSVSYTA